MIRLLKKLYFWLKHYVAKFMQPKIKEVFQQQKEIASGIEEAFNGYLKKEEEDDYIKPLPDNGKEENKVLFKIASRRFLILANLIPQTGYISYHTYEMTMDGAQYPNWLCTPIPELAFMVNLDKTAIFTEIKEYSTEAAIGEPVKTKTQIMYDFPKDYFDQLTGYIARTQPKPPTIYPENKN